MTDKQIVKAFYEGTYPAFGDCYIEDIYAFTNKQFEENHTFIQWLFPIHTASLYNLHAPIVTKEEAHSLGEDKDFCEKVQKSFLFVCNQYGLEVENKEAGIVVCPSSNFTGYWLVPRNHNHLRITRMLICLSNIGMNDYAEAFLECLEQLCNEKPGCTTEKTLKYWRNAVAEI